MCEVGLLVAHGAVLPALAQLCANSGIMVLQGAQLQELEAMERVKEMWRFKTMRAGEKCFKFWKIFRDMRREEKKLAARLMQGCLRRRRAKKELARRQAEERP